MDRSSLSFPGLYIDYFDSIPSTSQFLKNTAKLSLEPRLCITDLQTSGYGQRQANWESDQNSITFSLLLPVQYALNQLAGFSQLLAISIKGSLASHTKHDYRLKWPNDIYMSDSKVAGLLVEVVKNQDNLCWLVIGVGINIGSFEREFLDYSAKGIPLTTMQDKNDLIEKLINGLLNTIRTYRPEVWLNSISAWNNSDYFELNEIVRLKGWCCELGSYLGLSGSGGVLIGTQNNENRPAIFELTSGQVSIRKIEA